MLVIILYPLPSSIATSMCPVVPPSTPTPPPPHHLKTLKLKTTKSNCLVPTPSLTPPLSSRNIISKCHVASTKTTIEISKGIRPQNLCWIDQFFWWSTWILILTVRTVFFVFEENTTWKQCTLYNELCYESLTQVGQELLFMLGTLNYYKWPRIKANVTYNIADEMKLFLGWMKTLNLIYYKRSCYYILNSIFSHKFRVWLRRAIGSSVDLVQTRVDFHDSYLFTNLKMHFMVRYYANRRF